MKFPIIILLLFTHFCLFGQNKQIESYGFRHLQTIYQGDTVDILIKSKKGEELKRKPLLLFCQGSLPIPLIIKYDENGKQGIFHVFVFNPDSLSTEYHLAIIGKPFIPLVVDQKSLNSNMTFADNTGAFPKRYLEKNFLDYYVDRDIAVIKFLQKQSWVDKRKLVVSGHSEGSTVAAKLALKFPGVTELIYASGNPLGRILTIIEEDRIGETDSAKYAEDMIKHWKDIVDSSTYMNTKIGDTYKATYDFSIPPMQYLQQLKIPVLVCYGTMDAGRPFNDYFRVEMIRQKKHNFTFKAYIGLDHNFFPLKPNGDINYDIFNWDKVANYWRSWLKGQ
jgi:pimeloyl-ACP methyl ester carboxylesterase